MQAVVTLRMKQQAGAAQEYAQWQVQAPLACVLASATGRWTGATHSSLGASSTRSTKKTLGV